MIDISKGRYWDKPWSLVDGCTPCSPGCDHCWSAAMGHRFKVKNRSRMYSGGIYTDPCGPRFNGRIEIHPDRLSIPLKRRKPTVYAVWNDFWHESVPDDFQYKAYDAMVERHTYLILTKRPHIAAAYYREGKHDDLLPRDNIYHGLTICNQPEADAKIFEILKVPGKKFLSIEPMLGPIDLIDLGGPAKEGGAHGWSCLWKTPLRERIDAVILGGETGPGARPMHPDWVRSVRDQCQSAGVPFFFKGWGEWCPLEGSNAGHPIPICFWNATRREYPVGWMQGFTTEHTAHMVRVGRKKAGRLLDGRTHDELPWRVK